MQKRQPTKSSSAESVASEDSDDFSALLHGQFRPSNDERRTRIEAAVQTLAQQALALGETLDVAAFDTVSNVITALRQEMERRPEERDKLQTAVDQLSGLLSDMAGRDGAEALLDSILADPALLRALSANSGLALENEVRRFPITDRLFRREVRSDKPFSRQTLVNYFNSCSDYGRHHASKIVHDALAGVTEKAGQFIENKFSQKVSRYDDLAFRQEVLSGSLGYLSEDDRNFIQTSFDEAHAAWQNERRFILFIKDRLDESTDSLHPPSVVERTERLAAYAKEHGKDGLEDYARLLFPEWSFVDQSRQASPASIQLPTEAPENYQGLRGPETPPQFVQRVYGPWLSHGLTRAHIRKLDQKLYEGINNWLSRPGNEWPADVDLPTLKEQNSRWAERVQSEGLANVLGDASPGFALKEAARLSGVLQRRREQS